MCVWPGDRKNLTFGHSQLFKTASEYAARTLTITQVARFVSNEASWTPALLLLVRCFINPDLVFLLCHPFFLAKPCGVLQKTRSNRKSPMQWSTPFLKCRFFPNLFFQVVSFRVWLAECQSCYLDKCVPLLLRPPRPCQTVLYISLCRVLLLLVPVSALFWFLFCFLIFKK